MLAPETHAALIGWEPVNSRIITAKFTTKKKDIRLNIIQCYAPTNDAEEENKDDFYQQLQAVLDRRGAKDITLLMGDFNTKIGMDNTGYEDIMGTHGLGQMNENGERFADLCTLNHWWKEAASSHTSASIRPHGYPRTTSRRTRSTTYALVASSGDRGRMYEWWEVLTCHQTTTFLWQKWNFASRDSPPPTAHGQSTMLNCSETRTHKQLSRSAFPAGSSRYKSW